MGDQTPGAAVSWPLAAPDQAYALLSSARARLSESLFKRVSAPFLVSVPPAWTQSKSKVLVVGQETRGWGGVGREASAFLSYWANNGDAAALGAWYESFAYAGDDTPWWRAHRRIAAALGESPEAVGWTNLARVDSGPDSNGSRSAWWNFSYDEVDEVCAWQYELCHAEIDALAPRAIIFFTGPYYDYYLRKMWGVHLKFERLDGFEPRSLSRVRSNSISVPSYRTYHPNYLGFRLPTALDRLIDALVTDLA